MPERRRGYDRHAEAAATYVPPGNIVRREYFYLGLFGVTAIIAVVTSKECINRDQGWFLTLGLALSAAMVASQLTGYLAVKSNLPNQMTVRAGGALGVLVLILLLKPVLVPDGGPSQWICPVKLPTGKELPISALPTNLRPKAVATLDPTIAGETPLSFAFDYAFGTMAGKRTWTQVRKGSWIELYPDGEFFSAFELIETANLKSCHGSIVERTDQTKLQVFIPDRPCPSPILYFRVANGPWNVLGTMYDVR